MNTQTAASSSRLQATSTYYQNQPGLRAVRWLLGGMERIWPTLAQRLAYRLFCTPLPLRRGGHGIAWDAHWRIEAWPFEDASLTVYRYQSAPADAPKVLLLHGWGGYAGQMLALAQALAAQGMAPVLVDLPAHGHSRGRTSHLPQFSRTVHYLGARLGAEDSRPLAALVAHSLTANAAAHAAGQGLATARLVLLAPPASPREYLRLFTQVFGLSERTRAAVQRRIEVQQDVQMAQFEPACIGPHIGVPTLVVHDHGDNINRFADGQAYCDAIAGARLLATNGLGHRKILRTPEVVQAVCDFVRPS